MAVKRSLWSLTLLPGERTPLTVPRDFCLTNAALGEELRSETGRTVVKVTHRPIPASLFDNDSESDEDDGTEDEFELDEVEGFKLTPKKSKVNGIAKDDDEEHEDEEDDEDDLADNGELPEASEDDSDYSDEDDGLEETNVLCSLLAGKVEQATLNLVFCEGDIVVFEATGENSVHLMGNYVIQPDPDLSDSAYDSDELFDGPDDFDEIYADEDDEMDAEPEATIEEIVEKPVVAKPIAKEEKPAKVKIVDAPPESSKKRKAEEVDSPAPKPAAGTEGLSKTQKKKLAKKAKLEAKGEAPASTSATPAANGHAKGGDKQKRTLPSGLIIEDIKIGDGPIAKTGKRLGMRYIGKLENGKQFDANTSGQPFNFRLGKGEVIKGWDIGLENMAVGGERRLTIPAALAYGSQKLPGIPKNSTLKFDVKLVSVS